jgi:hypothetical protein
LIRPIQAFSQKRFKPNDLTRQVRFAALAAVHFEPPSVIAERLYGINPAATQPPSTDPLALIAQCLLDFPPSAGPAGGVWLLPQGLLGLFRQAWG